MVSQRLIQENVREEIYNHNRYIEAEKKHILESEIISKKNKELIFEFIDSRLARGFGKARISKLLNKLKRFLKN